MRYDVTHRHRTCTVVDDRTVVVAAAVVGRLLDETTGGAIRPSGTVQVDPPLRGRLVEGGRFAISALPAVDLPLLATDAYTIEASVRVPTFVHHALTFTLPPGTVLPLDAGDVTLRRRTVQVRGRVTHSVTGQPVTDALVFGSAPLAVQQLLVLRWPLRFDHGAGVEVRRRRLDDTLTATTLGREVRGGQDVLGLASRTGFGDNDVVRLSGGGRTELAVLASVSTEPPNPALPGDATLSAPLHRGFAAGAEVRRMDPDVVPQTRTLTADAHAGDGVLLLDGAIAPDGIDTVEVRDPGRVEYHVVGARTDPAGYYQLHGIGRVGELRLVGRAAGLSDAARTVAVDYAAGTNHVSFRLEP